MATRRTTLLLTCWLTGTALLSACNTTNPSSGVSVFDAWRKPTAPNSNQAADIPVELATAPGPQSTAPQPPPPSPTLVEVNGVPITHHAFLTRLMETHGLSLLEELIVLESARQMAAERGISVTQDEIDQAKQQAMDRLADAAATKPNDEPPPKLGQQLLEHFLREKRISHAEWALGIERMTYLLKLVEPDVAIRAGELELEYRRRYGERVQVRHIQLANEEQVKLVRAELEQGKPFVDAVREYSHNLETARAGGLLPLFVTDDPDTPGNLAGMAFSLESPGDVSLPIKVGPWYHILQLERRLDATDVPFEEVRDELARAIRERRRAVEAQQLAQKLFNQARVRIHNAELDQQFHDKFPSRAAAGS